MQLNAENTAIVVDSTADLPDPAARHPNWRLVPLYVRFGDESFRDHVDLSAADFYRRLREASEPPKTSQPTPADFESLYAGLTGYERIFVLVVSAKLSGTYETAGMVAASAGDERVVPVDTASVSGGMVLLADAIQRRLERGTTDDEIDELVARFRREAVLLFTLDTIDYLVRGGRVGKAAGLAGQLLNVKPILALQDGEVEPLKRMRGRAKALAELEQLFADGTVESQNLHVALAHADRPADAEDLAARIQRIRPDAALDVLTTLGPVVGTHGGPGALGLFWFDDAL